MTQTPSVCFSERITLAPSALVDTLASQGFGARNARGALALALLEALYLHERGTIALTNEKGAHLSTEQLERRARKLDKQLWIRSAVYHDLRERGYIVKTALKYGADFRVYDRGVKPGDDHSKWIVYPVQERAVFGWHDFAAKNRIAHGTKKRLLLAIVDDEGDVLYYEVRWTRP